MGTMDRAIRSSAPDDQVGEDVLGLSELSENAAG